MQRQILILLISCLLISCSSQQEKLKVNFYNIDLTRSDGWHDRYSINVDSSKHCIVKKFNDDESHYFEGYLPDTIAEKIFVLVDSINVTRYDTLYKPNCYDCQLYKIIINTKTQTLRTSVQGRHSLKHLDSLVRIFTTFTKLQNLNSIDTTFEFESFKDFLLPLTKTFSPPVVE
jgi:hypothetical protein